MGSDEGDEEQAPIQNLPEGVTKEIITEAPDSAWQKPKAGDEVKVHYVGTLEDGSQFDSSRERDKPFEFCLGKGQVIKGWDLGVATMKKGEVAKFTLAPEFAYGDDGSPPKIPEKATLVFEVELLSWATKDDLFADEGAIKTQVVEGSGWKVPKLGDEVRCTLRTKSADGTLIEERLEVEYSIGSGIFGPLSRAVDKALQSMKKGEEVSIKCSKEYMPEGGIVELSLLEMFETKDVSFNKDNSVMKKQMKEGEGWDTPKDGCRVKLAVQSALADKQPLAGFQAKTLEFTVGDGEVCDMLECAVLQMKKGEHALVTCKPELCAEAQLNLAPGVCSTMQLVLELQDFDKGKDAWSLSEEEKVAQGMARKEVGSNLFKRGRTEMALERYSKVVELLSSVDNFKEDTKRSANELKRVCELNKAACNLKLRRFPEARKACDAVLKDESSNIKAIFRKAQAEIELKEYGSCQQLVRRVLEFEPQNKEARVLLKQAQAGQKEEDRNVKGLYAKMFPGFVSKPSATEVSADMQMEETTSKPDASEAVADVRTE